MIKAIRAEFKFLERTDWLVASFAVISLLFILFYKFCLLYITEVWKGGSELGEITFNICLSALAASIFYFITVFLEKRRNRKLIRAVIDRRITRLNLDYHIIMKDIRSHSRQSADIQSEFPDSEEFKDMCKGIKLKGDAPKIWNGVLYSDPTNWFDYFRRYYWFQKYNIGVLLEFAHLLPIDLIPALDYLDNNHFLTALGDREHSTDDEDMGSISGPLWCYLKVLKEVGSNRNLAKWIIENNLLG